MLTVERRLASTKILPEIMR